MKRSTYRAMSLLSRLRPSNRSIEWRRRMELDEVQHGIAAAQSPAVMRFLADRRIRLNLCPTSNLMLGRVESLTEHPIRKLYDAGVRVTINTDDALVFGCSASGELLALHRAGLFSAKRT